MAPFDDLSVFQFQADRTVGIYYDRRSYGMQDGSCWLMFEICIYQCLTYPYGLIIFRADSTNFIGG